MRHGKLITDEDLLQLLRKGDEKAFAEIYNRYWEKLLAVGYYHTRDKRLAEDIVQDVMMSLWSRKEELEIESLNSYLATAARFAVFKTIARDKKRRELTVGKNISEGFSDIEEKLNAKFIKEIIQSTVEQLPEKTKLVFNHRRDEELSISEIAHKIDLSPKAVEYHITKALRAIKTKLQKIKSFFI